MNKCFGSPSLASVMFLLLALVFSSFIRYLGNQVICNAFFLKENFVFHDILTLLWGILELNFLFSAWYVMSHIISIVSEPILDTFDGFGDVTYIAGWCSCEFSQVVNKVLKSVIEIIRLLNSFPELINLTVKGIFFLLFFGFDFLKSLSLITMIPGNRFFN